MRGYWHFVAMSVVSCILTTYFNNYIFTVIFFLWLFYLFYHKRLGKVPLMIALIFFLFFSFHIPSKANHTKEIDNFKEQNSSLLGEITGPVKIIDTKVEFLFSEVESKRKVLIIYFPDDTNTSYSKLKYGASCKVTGDIALPDASRNPGQFDYRDYLSSQGITYQMIVKSIDDIHCEDASSLNKIYKLRTQMIYHIIDNRSTETAAWLNALVLGDDSYLDEEVVKLFQRWSLSHILAISGLHVGLIVALVYFILVKLNIVTKEKAHWIMILFLPLYALIAGGEPSVWRASMMVLFFIVLNKTKLKLSVTDILSIVFISLIVFDKYIVYHIGFQLSFIVTFGLILSKEWFSQSTSNAYRILQISFVSQMMIIPLQINYFATFQPLSILLNVIVVPYFSLFVIPLMFLLLLFSPLPNFFTGFLDTVFVQVHHLFLPFIKFVDKVAYFPLIVGDFPLVLGLLYYGLFFLMMKSIQSRRRIRSFKYGCAITLLIIYLGIRPYISPIGTVTMLDIGQGDAFVIELPYRKGVFFVDAGSSFSFDDFKPNKRVYEQIIQPYLYSRGIQKVDAIFLSHEHIDHIGSVPFLLEDMAVDKIVISNYYVLEEETALLWQAHDVDLRRVGINEEIHLKGQKFHVLAPSKDISVNDNSLVLYTELGGKSWLFTGDIGKGTEREITETYKNLSVDILKVAHHGSDTSTDPTFLKLINPDYALIPVGVKNMYSHPKEEVLETLEKQNLHILRTDEDGAVQFKFKNNEGTFSKYLP